MASEIPQGRLGKAAWVLLVPSLLATPHALFLWAVAENSHRGSHFLQSLIFLGPISLWLLGAMGLVGIAAAIVCLLLLRRSAPSARHASRRLILGVTGGIASLTIAWILYSSDKLNMTWWW